MSLPKPAFGRMELGTMVANVFFDVFFVQLVTLKRHVYKCFTTLFVEGTPSRV